MAKFQGFPYPIQKNPRGFFFAQNGVEQIKADMLQLLLTNPGERVMLPAFGTPLRQLIFEPNDASLAIRAKQMIVNSVQAFEPRVSIDQINVTTNVDSSILDMNDDLTESNHILTIQILFRDPDNIQEIQDLTLEVPLTQG